MKNDGNRSPEPPLIWMVVHPYCVADHHRQHINSAERDKKFPRTRTLYGRYPNVLEE